MSTVARGSWEISAVNQGKNQGRPLAWIYRRLPPNLVRETGDAKLQTSFSSLFHSQKYSSVFTPRASFCVSWPGLETLHRDQCKSMLRQNRVLFHQFQGFLKIKRFFYCRCKPADFNPLPPISGFRKYIEILLQRCNETGSTLLLNLLSADWIQQN